MEDTIKKLSLGLQRWSSGYKHLLLSPGDHCTAPSIQISQLPVTPVPGLLKLFDLLGHLQAHGAHNLMQAHTNVHK